MKNFIITLIIYRACLIRIRPASWYLLPTWEEDYDLSNKAKWITVKYPYSITGELKDTTGKENYKLAWRKGILISWLCFTLQFTRWKCVHELQTIYGEGYDCDTDPLWREKYEQLCATEYFN